MLLHSELAVVRSLKIVNFDEIKIDLTCIVNYLVFINANIVIECIILQPCTFINVCCLGVFDDIPRWSHL